MDEREYSEIGAPFGLIVAILTFLGCWGYCTLTYGFLFGFGLGWIPSAIAAVIAFFAVLYLWPILLVVVALIGLFIFYQMTKPGL